MTPLKVGQNGQNMSKATMKIQGYLSRDPELKFSNAGKAFLNLSIPHTPRKFDKAANDYVDAGDTLWVQATAWEGDAEALAPLLSKNSHVVVEGEPVLRAWESNGKSGVNLEIKFPTVSIIPKKAKSGGQRQSAPADEPWGQPAGQSASGWATPGQGGATDDFQTPPF